MTVDIKNIVVTGMEPFLNSVSNNPVLLSKDVAGRIVIADRIRYEPEIGDFQIIGGKPKVWNGTRWIDKEWRASYDPISFKVPPGEEVWTVYPGWKAMHGQLLYCHTCFASKVSKDGGMPGWWITPNHTDAFHCNICGRPISQMSTIGNHTAFVRKAVL